MRLGKRLTIIAPLLAATLTGCAMLGGGAGTPGQPPPTAASAPPTQVAVPTPESVSGSGGVPQVPSGGTVVSKEVRAGETTLSVEITGLRREGQLVTLNWTIANIGDGDWSLYTYMSADGETEDVSGVSLVDPVNAKRYRVARSGGPDGACVCSPTDDYYYLDAGAAAALYATFPAPPPEVTKINVEFPQLGQLTDVPIS